MAIDDFEFIRSECMFKPHDASPPTPEPTESTPAADTPTHCTFQVDDCGFEIEGDGDFKFERTSGSQVDAIGSDHHENTEGMFLYAQSSAREPSSVYTYVITGEFDGTKHTVECFHFWFYLDGFLVTYFLFSFTNLYHKLCRMVLKMSLFKSSSDLTQPD